MNKYIIFWERMANSGTLMIEAENEQEASKVLSPKFCKITVVKLTAKPYVIGEAN